MRRTITKEDNTIKIQVSNHTLRREDIVSWLRQQKNILMYGIRLMEANMTTAIDSKEVSKYGYLKRKAVKAAYEVNQYINKAFSLEDKKYFVEAVISRVQPNEVDDPFTESQDQKDMYRDNVAKAIGDLKSILYSVNKSEHFKDKKYISEIYSWQGETRDAKEYILNNFEEGELVRYKYVFNPV